MLSNIRRACQHPFVLLLALTLLGALAPASKARAEQVGLLVVDVQQHFIKEAKSNPATATALRVSENLLRHAAANAAPVFVTYESSSTGSHAMPAELTAALPQWHRVYIKTRYAATDLPPLVAGLERSGVTRIVLVGSETDVCVLLTALGLRQLGYDVLVVRDGVFSSELNVEPALERMRQAGVVIGDNLEAERALAGAAPPPRVDAFRQPNLMIEPLADNRANAALILSAVVPTTEPIDGCSIAPRVERYREILLLAEWLELPVYIAGNLADHAKWADTALGFDALGERISRQHVRPLAELDARKYANLIVAGHVDDMRHKLAQIGAPRRLFAITDAGFSEGTYGSPPPSFASFVPLTYKTFYREVTGSVSYDDWPSRWVERKQDFISLLKDPEGLRPVGGPDCPQVIGDSLETQTR